MYVNRDKTEKSECADHLCHRISTNDNASILCPSLQLLVSGSILICSYVILVTHILL